MSTDGRDGFVRATQEPQARTRAFARVLGPWLLIVPSIIALRAPEMGAIRIGGDHRAVRLDPGSPRLGPHGRSQTLRTRRRVYGHDTSWAARVRCPRSDRAYLTYVGWGCQARLSGRKGYSMTKAVDRTSLSTSTRNFVF